MPSEPTTTPSTPNINVTRQFALAGEAVFTVSNGDRHFTYTVDKAKPTVRYPDPVWFIKVKTGPSEDDWTYMGRVINIDPRAPVLIKRTEKSHFDDTALCMVVARWALRAIWQVSAGTYTLPAPFTILHEGKCARCGAPLTHPASIAAGFGPECARLEGVNWGNGESFTAAAVDTETGTVTRD